MAAKRRSCSCVTVVASDTSQYYAGRLFGRTLLAPAISPKKTVEGAVGGFVGGAWPWRGWAAVWLPDVPLPVAPAPRPARSSRSASPATCSSRCSSARRR